MALTVETGAIVPNADSYITLVDARTYAAARGITISATDGTAEIQLRKAFDYLESLRGSYKGVKVDTAQTAQWPRAYVTIDGIDLASNVIPTELKNAQVQLAAAVNSGIDIMPTSTGTAFIKREKVGPIDTEYSEVVSTSGVPIVRIVDALLAPLLNRQGVLATERA